MDKSDKSQVSKLSGESTTSSPGPVAAVIERMRTIRDGLDPRDGVACFNRMYLQVTELIGQNLVEGFFEDNSLYRTTGCDLCVTILSERRRRGVWSTGRPVLATTFRRALQPCGMAHPVRLRWHERTYQSRPSPCGRCHL